MVTFLILPWNHLDLDVPLLFLVLNLFLSPLLVNISTPIGRLLRGL